MTRPAQQLNQAPGDDLDLLGDLLRNEVPSRRNQIRPARLRSATQQRHIALRGFLLRTWVDHGLHLLERALVVAAVLSFGYWLADGYGRDWLHALRSAQAAPLRTDAPTPTPPLHVPDEQVPPVAAAPAPAVVSAALAEPAPLPFTRPEEAPAAGSASADFLAPQAVPVSPDMSDPRPVRLLMPAISIDTPINEVFVRDGEWEVAEYAAGYHNGTSLPGNVGNVVLSGHAGLRGAVFRDIGQLKPGDDLVVETSRWRYTYRVRGSSSVWPTQIEVMAPTSTPVLTLITCTNWDTQRLVVVADLVDARPLS